MTLRSASVATILMALVVGASFASPVLVEADFDSGSYTVGDLDGQNGWQVVQGSGVQVQAGVVDEGDQAVSLPTNSVIELDQTAPDENVVWTRASYRGPGTTAAADYPTSDPASAIVHFSAGDEVAPGVNGPGIFFADGNADGSTPTWVAAPDFTTINSDVFYEITIRQDYASQTYDVWINGMLEGSDLGFRDNVTELNGFRVYSGSTSYLDTFMLRRRSAGDLNEDGTNDASDVVLNVNAITSNPTDIILFDDADYNEDGVIDSDDVTLTATDVVSPEEV